VLANIATWQSVAMPAPGHSQDFDIIRGQTHFFVELTKHRLFWGFVGVNPALRKLPRVSAADSAAPQDITPLVTDDDSDIRPKPIGIDHPIVTIGDSQNFFSCRATVKRARRALFGAQSLLPRLLTRILSQIHHQRHRRRKSTDLKCL